MPDDPITTAQAAALAGVSPRVIASWRAQGRLRAACRVKGVSLYRPADVLARRDALAPLADRDDAPGSDPTEEELDALIEQQRKCLPVWWDQPDPDPD